MGLAVGPLYAAYNTWRQIKQICTFYAIPVNINQPISYQEVSACRNYGLQILKKSKLKITNSAITILEVSDTHTTLRFPSMKNPSSHHFTNHIAVKWLSLKQINTINCFLGKYHILVSCNSNQSNAGIPMLKKKL